MVSYSSPVQTVPVITVAVWNKGDADILQAASNGAACALNSVDFFAAMGTAMGDLNF